MLSSERPQILTDEHIISQGRKDYYRYLAEARNSEIPESLLGISRVISLDYLLEFSSRDIGELLFETKFETDQEALLAIKYAEAIAAIKNFEKQLNYDSEGPIIRREDLERVYLHIGLAVVNEPQGEEAEVVKLTVEEYFETHPFASMKMEFISREFASSRVH